MILRAAPLVASLLALALGACSLWLAADYRNAAQAGRDTATREQGRLTGELAALRERAPRIHQAAERIAELVDDGWLSPPAPEAWLARAETVSASLGARDPDIGFATSSTGSAPPVAQSPPLAMHTQAMRLSARLRHEGRFLALLDQLGKSGPGLLLPRRCRLDNSSAATDPLGVACELDWITLVSATPAHTP